MTTEHVETVEASSIWDDMIANRRRESIVMYCFKCQVLVDVEFVDIKDSKNKLFMIRKGICLSCGTRCTNLQRKP